MKKFLVLSLAVLLLAGCGKSNKVVCSGKVEEGGETYEAKITGYLENDKIKSVDAEMVFTSEETAKTMCGLMSLANGMAEEDGQKLDVKCDGKKMTIKGFDKLDSTEEDESKLTNATKEDFIKYFQEESDYKLVCK